MDTTNSERAEFATCSGGYPRLGGILGTHHHMVLPLWCRPKFQIQRITRRRPPAAGILVCNVQICCHRHPHPHPCMYNLHTYALTLLFVVFPRHAQPTVWHTRHAWAYRSPTSQSWSRSCRKQNLTADSLGNKCLDNLKF